MRWLGALLVSIALLAGGALGAIYLGLPDVGATTSHWKATEWVLSTTMEQAVQRRALGVSPPGDLDDPARVRAGASAYDAMCVTCHAAPGVEASALASGLLPEPPALAEEADAWNPAELFWITKHGIRMTGMAAFGPTHSDEEIWDVVAFLRRLPSLSSSEYRSLIADGNGKGPGREHSH